MYPLPQNWSRHCSLGSGYTFSPLQHPSNGHGTISVKVIYIYVVINFFFLPLVIYWKSRGTLNLRFVLYVYIFNNVRLCKNTASLRYTSYVCVRFTFLEKMIADNFFLNCPIPKMRFNCVQNQLLRCQISKSL